MGAAKHKPTQSYWHVRHGVLGSFVFDASGALCFAQVNPYPNLKEIRVSSDNCPTAKFTADSGEVYATPLTPRERKGLINAKAIDVIRSAPLDGSAKTYRVPVTVEA